MVSRYQIGTLVRKDHNRRVDLCSTPNIHQRTLWVTNTNVQYSLIHKTNVFTIYISTYLHIYISILHILYLLIVVLANFNLLSRPFIMLPPGRQLASGRSGRHAMHHANLILIDCAGGFLPSICQFANVCFYINLRLGELLANYEASWGQILAPSQ